MRCLASPPRAAPRRTFGSLLALALAAQGCTLFDTRSQLHILPEGTLLAGRTLTVKVQGPASSEAQLYVDGETLGGPVPVGVTVTVDTSAVAEGKHALVARLAAAAEPRASAPSTLIVDRTPPAVVAWPPEVLTDPLQPLVIELSFSEPIDPDSLALALTSTYVAAVPAAQQISADRTLVALQVEPPLDQYGAIRLEGTAADRIGNTARFSLSWHLPDVDVSYAQPADGAWVSGVAQVQADASPSVTQGVLYANGVEVASLGPPPWSVPWDSTTVPDGAASLEIRVPGRYVRSAPLSVQVDNTPPSVVVCAPARGVDPSIRDCIDVGFSEELSPGPGAVTVTIGNASQVVLAGWAPEPGIWLVCPPALGATLPAVEVLSFPEVRDRAGNAVSGTCNIPLRPWRRPFGDVPLEGDQGPIVATSIAIETYYEPVDWLAVFAVVPPAAGGAQGLLGYEGTPPGPLRYFGKLNYDTSSVAAGVQTGLGLSWIVAWTERIGAGPGQIRVRDLTPPTGQTGEYPPLNADAGRDADHPTLESVIAWSEENATGGRSIQLQRLDGSGFGLGVPSDAAASAENPSLSGMGPGGIPGTLFTSPTVVFLETPPRGSAQVRVAGWAPDSSIWETLGSVVNVDAGTPGSDPLLVADPIFVLWVEGGRILARPWDPSVLDWGAAQVLNVDPARPARLLRSLPRATVAFVEATPAGDEVWARRWDGSAWQLLPGPASDGYSGSILDLAAAHVLPAVAWTDPEGKIYFRAYNE